MMSTNNVLSPANGAPIIVPSQDMILGLYYTTIMREGMKGEGMIFGSIEEVQFALDNGDVHLHAKITVVIHNQNLYQQIFNFHVNLINASQMQVDHMIH